MRRSLVLMTCALFVAGGLVAAPARATSQTDAVESRLLVLINQGRAGQGKGAEVMHSGLRLAAQQHSADMSARNSMDHNGYPARISNANPDPAESNGPPDDGFNGSSCENVAWYQPGGSATSDEVAQKFFDLWYNSSPHRRCMYDEYGYNLNVAGVGVYNANGKWWATFESALDRTPPGGSSSPPPSSTPPPSSGTWRRVQQTGSGVTYTGSWSTTSTSNASGGSYRRSNVTGATAKFTFTGTGVKWIGLLANSGGIANVKLDGSLVATVNQYALSTEYGRVLFQRTSLANSRHTLEISVSGNRDSRAIDRRAFVDAFEYFS